MKKTVFILAALLSLSLILCSCGGGKNPDGNSKDNAEVAQVEDNSTKEEPDSTNQDQTEEEKAPKEEPEPEPTAEPTAEPTPEPTEAPTEKPKDSFTVGELDDALVNFRDGGDEFLTKHKKAFKKVKEAKLKKLISGKKWHIDEIKEQGTKNAFYRFETNGKILETLVDLPDYPPGYYNNLTWSIDGSKLIIKHKGEKTKYVIRKVAKKVYVGYRGGKARIIIGNV